MDETWVNAGHTKAKVWKDKTIVSARQAFLEGLSTSLPDPSGKGKRFIITQVGNENGFLPGGLWMCESKKTGDYHEEMTGEVFDRWMLKILPKLPLNAVIESWITRHIIA